MKILIAGRHVGVTDSMKEYARAKVEKLLKYFDRVTTARVTMDVDHQEQTVEMALEVSRGVTLVGKAGAPDMYAACDLAEQKLAQQLRRYKSRLRDHHRGEKWADAEPGVGEAPVADAAGGEREWTYEEVVDRMRRGEAPPSE
ncbi:MAG: ribosome-associated translation inhibitor RaiA [Planctomycetota bacterium]|nr:ribosome-associated translation inhibitor RaiA [Planctomycetota bacterium]